MSITEEAISARLLQIRQEKEDLLARLNALAGAEQDCLFWRLQLKEDPEDGNPKKTPDPAKKAPAAKPKTYKGKSTAPGGGGAFAMMEDALMKKGMSEAQAGAVTASAGRKKYGKQVFAAMGQAGKARAARKRKRAAQGG